MRILLTGGGTAGHVNPALAIADTIKQRDPDAQIEFVASALPRDKALDLVPRAGYPLHTVHIEGLSRPVWKPSNLKIPFVMAKAKREAEAIITAFKPDLIVGTGGYACWPVCHVGIKQGIPTVLHESNALPGRAVERLAGKATAVLVNFAETAERLGGDKKIIRVGNPMMAGFAAVSREEARRTLGLAADESFILSFGGSLGAEYVNDAVVALAGRLTDSAYGKVSLLHAAGKRDIERVRAAWDAVVPAAEKRLSLTDYIYDMPLRMAAADLVISRAGAMSLSELALMGKAAVLIPSPYVAEQHQLKNAMALVKKDAAVCVEEHTLASGCLTDTVLSLLADTAGRTAMQQNIAAFACPDANERIYQALLEVTEKA